MRILIDTNILIHLEDYRIIEEEFSQFYHLAIVNDCQVLYHKACIRDVERDKNETRREIIQSKLRKYQHLEHPATPSQEFISVVGQRKENDEIDNLQLFQLYKGYIDLFVTEDNGIHNKAKKLGLINKVLKVKEALGTIREKFEIIIPHHPLLCHVSMREIEHRLGEPFFDSLKSDYKGFEQWFNKSAQRNRKCFILTVDKKLAAILIHNIESPEEHQIDGLFQKALKMCTLKVADSAFGHKVGELFIHKAIELCLNQSLKYLYLTVYEKQSHLIQLLEKFGFYRTTFTNSEGQKELRMVKGLDKTKLKNSRNLISIHPFYSDSPNFKKFIVPIRPEYYHTLFKDSLRRNVELFDQTAASLKEIQETRLTRLISVVLKVRLCNLGTCSSFMLQKRQKWLKQLEFLSL
jgi:predicted GNAT family N-acyltransferase